MTKLSFERPLSLTIRVTLLVGLVITISFTFLSLAIQKSMSLHFLQQDIGELEVVARAVKQNLYYNFKDEREFQNKIENTVSGHHGVFFLVADQKKKILFESSGPNLSLLLNDLKPVDKISLTNLYSWKEKDTTYRGVLLQFFIKKQQRPSKFYVMVATSTTFNFNYLNEFKHKSWIILFFSLLITYLASWWAVSFGHKPLSLISDQIGNISSSRLHRRFDPVKFPIELVGLVGELNKLLIRIEASYLRLSHFSADIAHELRTPITNLMTQTQVALSRSRDVNAYREILYSNLEEYERIALMVSDMLFLAKSDNGLIQSTQVLLDLDHEIAELYDYFDAIAHDKNIDLKFQSCHLKLHGDRAMLRRALSNLYANAIRYTDRNGKITTYIDELEDWITVCIENSGNRIPEQHLERIFDRFYRVDWARKRNSEGVGLGLAITRSIVEFHGGSIEAVSNDQATQFIMRFPSKSALEISM